MPTSALELALWMESDRMGYLLPALTRERFETQRDVVLNERRQNYENRPVRPGADGADAGALSAGASVSLDDDRRRRRHPRDGVRRRAGVLPHVLPSGERVAGAGRATSIPSAAFELAEAYFGDIPGRPETVEPVRADASLTREIRLVLEDRVELPRIYMAWHSPAMFADGDAEADLVADLLANGKTSRLYRTLVYDQRIALDVSAYQHSREIGSFFLLAVDGRSRPIADRNHGAHRRADSASSLTKVRLDEEMERGLGAGRGAFHVPAADGRRLRRQVRSAQCLQRVPRRSRISSPDDLARYRSATP